MIDIFIDESGIHKKVDHSSYILVYIKVNNLEKLEKAIINIEKDLTIEFFHWASTAWPVKEQFIKRALDLDYNIKIAIIRNPVKPDQELERVLSHTIIENNINRVTIDGKKPRWYGRKIKLVLRNKGISVRKLKTMNDNQSPGIRLADMCAGLVRTYYDKSNHKVDKYYRKLKSKIIVILQ